MIEEDIKKGLFKLFTLDRLSMSSYQSQVLIPKEMKAKSTEVGDGVPDKKYDSEEVYALIHIANYIP